jgi:hypothetical protein
MSWEDVWETENDGDDQMELLSSCRLTITRLSH